MPERIEDPTIRQNVEFLLNSLRGSEQVKDEDKKVTACFVNHKTGQFYPQDSTRLKSMSSLNKELKPISIVYSYNPETREVRFIVTDSTDEISSTASQVLIHTLRVLNDVCHHLKASNDLAAMTRELCSLRLVSEIVDPDWKFIVSAWHDVDRIQAETLLLDTTSQYRTPVGSYFFRKDEYAQVLEEELKTQMGQSVICLTLTYKSDEEKISELILVFYENKWQLYNDDPSLNQEGYHGVKQLIEQRPRDLKFPVYSDVIEPTNRRR